ncbi:hypothetical protein NRB20_47070 [Nocardia sp. RB20]|uniref:Secreted protein n=2 Tax=Nocardia macrotermitis TaxID=2585198 RepID=A0A7K0D9Q7_9NOCA|nr:hypothetical protein [Nocardia macrotermitis]
MGAITLVGAAAVFAAAGTAAAYDTPCGRYYCSCDDLFRTPTEADAYTTNRPVVVGPYGRSRIYCHDDAGRLDAWQLGPGDQQHQLYSVTTLTNSATGKIYVWNPNWSYNFRNIP